MSDTPWIPDHPEDIVYLAIPTLAVIGLLAGMIYYTELDAHVRFAVDEQLGYMAETEKDLVFAEDSVDRMNWAASNSLGVGAIADERLFCFDVVDGHVRNLKLVDDINESKITSVSGRCFERATDIAGFAHTHPDFNKELSDEDKDVPPGIRYTCIQYAEIVESPSGSVYGLNCWDVTADGFQAVEVGIQ